MHVACRSRAACLTGTFDRHKLLLHRVHVRVYTCVSFSSRHCCQWIISVVAGNTKARRLGSKHSPIAAFRWQLIHASPLRRPALRSGDLSPTSFIAVSNLFMRMSATTCGTCRRFVRPVWPRYGWLVPTKQCLILNAIISRGKLWDSG